MNIKLILLALSITSQIYSMEPFARDFSPFSDEQGLDMRELYAQALPMAPAALAVINNRQIPFRAIHHTIQTGVKTLSKDKKRITHVGRRLIVVTAKWSGEVIKVTVTSLDN